jgi:membrane-associated protease RseP (regulator of RpoE activity)
MAESIRTIPPGFETFGHYWSKPTARQWRFHILLFILTIVTTTLSGVMLAQPELGTDPSITRPIDYVTYLPIAYVTSVVEFFRYTFQHPELVYSGVAFSASLLAILLSHEMGHYLACRHYRVDATLPYFIPAPPLFLAGTFGAFIKIKSPIPSRRALFDIGLAGPFAGFVVAIPIAVIGLVTIAPPVSLLSGIYFNDPFLFKLLARLVGVRLDPNTPTNPYYMAAWIGLLVTSLNLMPVGQLDGGHATFSVFGPRAHKIIGQVAFGTVATLSVLGFWWYRSPSGFLYTILLAVMLRVRHPEPPVMEGLGIVRTLIALLTLIVFALCFLPFPIMIK